MSWYITNRTIDNSCAYSTNLDISLRSDSQISVFIDGYIIPRKQIFEEYKDILPEDMVKRLYKKYGRDFINFVKGVFVIIMFENDKFCIFNDRHSLKKYFVYKKDDIFFISNSLNSISDNVSLSLDKENVAIFSLVSHFISGQMLFKHVVACQPAGCIEFEAGQLRQSFYWHPKDIILSRKINNRKISDYAQEWKQIINGYITYLNPKGISLTLTGGNDSRMVLAALLSLDLTFHTFAFGNPQSNDCVIAEEIRHTAKISHSNYFVENPTCEWFQMCAKEIMSFGNSLVNIHRAHRKDSIAAEINDHPESEMIFTGLVGGEYLKEPAYNNITIPVLFDKLRTLNNKSERLHLIEEKLKEKGVFIDKVDIQSVLVRIQEFLDHANGLTEAERKFVYTYLFYGCSHHTQDSTVFDHYVRYVVNPFMDIDFLELIAGYKKWYLNRKQWFFHKAFHSELLVGITDILASGLSEVPYAKKGEFSANDLLRHKTKYIIKRLSHYIRKDKNSYPPNFPMGQWLNDYCDVEFSKLNDEILELFDLKTLKEKMKSLRNVINEEGWHIMTNPINISLNYEYYKKA